MDQRQACPSLEMARAPISVHPPARPETFICLAVLHTLSLVSRQESGAAQQKGLWMISQRFLTDVSLTAILITLAVVVGVAVIDRKSVV